MARQRGFPLAHRSRRRTSAWEEGVGGVAVQAQITASGTTLVTSALAAAVDGLTLVRTRGRLQLFLTAAGSPLDGFAGAFGIGLATAAAVTAGAASVPGPITEQDWDGWLYWTPLQIIAVGIIDGSAATDSDNMNAVTAAKDIEVDSKAMRKLGLGDSLYGALELSETGVATLNWRFDSRMLFKLNS